MKIKKLHKKWRESIISKLEESKNYGYFATDKAQIDFAKYCIRKLRKNHYKKNDEAYQKGWLDRPM